MRQPRYAYASAAVRARAARLLSAEEAAWLWTVDREAVIRALQHKGWRTDGPAEEMAVARRQEAWAFVTSIAPDAKALRFLLAEEEFLNLFVCTMAQMSGGDQAPVWALPCITPPSVPCHTICKKARRRPGKSRSPARS